jgi:hypothetical protein
LNLLSCATPIKTNQSQINFNEVKNLAFGKITRKTLENKFGKPSSEYEFDQDFIALNYNRNSNGTATQRASFNIDKKEDKVISVLWFPNSSDKVITADEFKKMFLTSNFSKLRVKQTNSHEFVDDYELTDDSLGVSAEINNKNNTINNISLFMPKEKRTPANMKN